MFDVLCIQGRLYDIVTHKPLYRVPPGFYVALELSKRMPVKTYVGENGNVSMLSSVLPSGVYRFWVEVFK